MEHSGTVVSWENRSALSECPSSFKQTSDKLVEFLVPIKGQAETTTADRAELTLTMLTVWLQCCNFTIILIVLSQYLKIESISGSSLTTNSEKCRVERPICKWLIFGAYGILNHFLCSCKLCLFKCLFMLALLLSPLCSHLTYFIGNKYIKLNVCMVSLCTINTRYEHENLSHKPQALY